LMGLGWHAGGSGGRRLRVQAIKLVYR
jgi:hypothetical protein